MATFRHALTAVGALAALQAFGGIGGASSTRRLTACINTVPAPLGTGGCPQGGRQTRLEALSKGAEARWLVFSELLRIAVVCAKQVQRLCRPVTRPRPKRPHTGTDHIIA
jgi:hypothetical protein